MYRLHFLIHENYTHTHNLPRAIVSLVTHTQPAYVEHCVTCHTHTTCLEHCVTCHSHTSCHKLKIMNGTQKRQISNFHFNYSVKSCDFSVNEQFSSTSFSAVLMMSKQSVHFSSDVQMEETFSIRHHDGRDFFYQTSWWNVHFLLDVFPSNIRMEYTLPIRRLFPSDILMEYTLPIRRLFPSDILMECTLRIRCLSPSEILIEKHLLTRRTDGRRLSSLIYVVLHNMKLTPCDHSNTSIQGSSALKGVTEK